MTETTTLPNVGDAVSKTDILNAAVAILSSQAVRFGDVDALQSGIKTTFKTIEDLLRGEPAVIAVSEPQKPAVPISKSVTNDFIICLEDGKKFRSLKRHIRTHFNLSPEEYREKWRLPANYPMTAPSYSEMRSNLAKENGLGTKK